MLHSALAQAKAASFQHVLAEIGRADFWLSALESFRKPVPKAGAMSEDEVARWVDGLLEDSTNLREATLFRADLRAALLCAADLSGAHLRAANLRAADLRAAYLRGAYLRGANLRGANLRGADQRFRAF